MRPLYRRRFEGEMRNDTFFTYSKYHSNNPTAKSWNNLYTFSFFPTAKSGFLIIINLLPDRTIPMFGIRFGRVRPSPIVND